MNGSGMEKDMEQQDAEYIRQVMHDNRTQIMPLLRYLPWLLQHAGQEGSSNYSGDGLGEHSIAFPVYDGTLMNFVKEAQKSALMDKNYRYIYTRHRIKSHEEERIWIERATWKEWDVLRGILSNYVLGGRTKAALWNEGLREKIFYLTLSKMKEIVEYWDQPINV